MYTYSNRDSGKTCGSARCERKIGCHTQHICSQSFESEKVVIKHERRQANGSSSLEESIDGVRGQGCEALVEVSDDGEGEGV